MPRAACRPACAVRPEFKECSPPALYSHSRRLFLGRQPLCGMGVTSSIAVTSTSSDVTSERSAVSRPLPIPLTFTTSERTPFATAAVSAFSAASCPAKGVFLRVPLRGAGERAGQGGQLALGAASGEAEFAHEPTCGCGLPERRSCSGPREGRAEREGLTGTPRRPHPTTCGRQGRKGRALSGRHAGGSAPRTRLKRAVVACTPAHVNGLSCGGSPAERVAVEVRDVHDGVVERGLHVRCATQPPSSGAPHARTPPASRTPPAARAPPPRT